MGVLTFTNSVDSEITGFELGASGDYDIYNWRLGYSYVEVEDTPFGAIPVDIEQRYPRHGINAELGFKADGWWGNVSATYVDHYASDRLSGFFPVAYEVDDHIILNAVLGYNLSKDVSVSLYGKNLNGKHYQTGTQELEPQVFLTTHINF